MVWSDYISLNGTLQGNGIIWYGFLVGQQVAPGETIHINWETILNQQFIFAKNQYYDQIPPGAQVIMVVQGAVTWNHVNMEFWALSFFDKFANWFRQALEYREYNPRTINFLEWPMWNGKFINQYFFVWIIILLAVALIAYRFSTERKDKRNSILFGAGVLIFFWIFFDFFSTNNQIKIYKQTMSATNIMENGRVGRNSDFYTFLDFIKTKVPKWSQWSFIAPYPYNFEWKYHIYPDVKFNILTWVKYIFYYNSYGAQAPFNFKDPIYANGVLTWDTLSFPVQEEIVRKPYAKIYILKK